MVALEGVKTDMFVFAEVLNEDIPAACLTFRRSRDRMTASPHAPTRPPAMFNGRFRRR
jgi:hypothetical protein